MQRLPYNPEPLLALFMSQANAGSLAGDLTERFQKISLHRGPISAYCWFFWQVTSSMCSIISTWLTTPATRFIPATATPTDILDLSNQVILPTPLKYDPGSKCLIGKHCLSGINWYFERGGAVGFCRDCSARHIQCFSCGCIILYGEHRTTDWGRLCKDCKYGRFPWLIAT